MKSYELLISKSKNSQIKTALTLFICLLISTTMLSQKAQNTDVGILEFEAEVIDYGTISKDANGLRTFKFTNVGTAPIIIADVKTSCGCTVPKYSQKPILPGKTGEIEIKYDTKKVGSFAKTITVMSNAKESSKKLKIKGEISKPLTAN